MKKEKLNESGSDFLKSLSEAVNSGDPNKGKDAIEKINEIHKLAENMNSDTAKENFDKRIEKAGHKEKLLTEEREKITIEAEREKVKREKEESRLAMLAEIMNAERQIEEVEEELEEVTIKYNNIITLQKEELDLLTIKYKARFGEDNDGE